MSFETAAQQIIYTALTATPVSVSVYDDAPFLPSGAPKNGFPYIVIGEGSVLAWDTDDTVGAQVSCDVHVWSRAAGFKEAKAIMGEVRSILHRGSFVKAGFRVVDCLCTDTQSLADPDGETRHGVVRVRLTLQEDS